MNRPTATGSFPVMDSHRPMIDHRSVDYSPRYRKMTAARRREIFGPIQSLADEAREAGEPSFWTGLAVVVGFAALFTFIWGVTP